MSFGSSALQEDRDGACKQILEEVGAKGWIVDISLNFIIGPAFFIGFFCKKMIFLLHQEFVRLSSGFWGRF